MTHARHLYCFGPHYDAVCAFLYDVHTDHVAREIRQFHTVEELQEHEPDHVTVVMMEGPELPETIMDYLADHPSTVLCSINATNHNVVRHA